MIYQLELLLLQKLQDQLVQSGWLVEWNIMACIGDDYHSTSFDSFSYHPCVCFFDQICTACNDQYRVFDLFQFG